MRRAARSRGFSPVEIMIVVAVLGALAVLAIPLYLDYVSTSKKTASRAIFETALRVLTDERSKRVTYHSPRSLRVTILEGQVLNCPFNIYVLSKISWP